MLGREEMRILLEESLQFSFGYILAIDERLLFNLDAKAFPVDSCETLRPFVRTTEIVSSG